MGKLLHFLVKVLIGGLILYFIFKIIKDFNTVNLNSTFGSLDLLKVLISVFAYLLSHFVRVLRFSLMLGRQNYSIVQLIKTQYFTNSINLLLPFKFGEIYRIIEFEKTIKNYQKTFLTVVAERSIDFVLIVFGLIVSAYLINEPLYYIKPIVILGFIFIVGILYSFLLLPQNIRFMNIFIIKRFSNAKSVFFLKYSSKIHDSIEMVREIILKEKATLLVLSFIIWGLELLSFLYLTDFSPSIWHTLFLGCLVFVSALLPSGSFGIGGIQLAFYLVFKSYMPSHGLELSITYQAIIFIPAVLIGSSVWILSKLNSKP